jgi:hypothetical protein
LKAHHRRLVLIGLALTVAAWLAWMVLLTESDEAPPPEGRRAAATRIAALRSTPLRVL